LPPKDSKEEEFIRTSPFSSKLSKISDIGLLRTLQVEIWTTTSLSPSRLADTDDKELYMVSFLWFSWWIKSSCLDRFDRSSSFLWIRLSTCCWSSGMYLSTREIVDGMLNFFYNGIITKVKVSMQRERDIQNARGFRQGYSTSLRIILLLHIFRIIKPIKS